MSDPRKFDESILRRQIVEPSDIVISHDVLKELADSTKPNLKKIFPIDRFGPDGETVSIDRLMEIVDEIDENNTYVDGIDFNAA